MACESQLIRDNRLLSEELTKLEAALASAQAGQTARWGPDIGKLSAMVSNLQHDLASAQEALITVRRQSAVHQCVAEGLEIELRRVEWEREAACKTAEDSLIEIRRLVDNPKIGHCNICGMTIWRKDGMIEEDGRQWHLLCRQVAVKVAEATTALRAERDTAYAAGKTALVFTNVEIVRLIAALPCKEEHCGCGGYELLQKLSALAATAPVKKEGA